MTDVFGATCGCFEGGDAFCFEAGFEFGGVAFLDEVTEGFEGDVVFGSVWSGGNDTIFIVSSLFSLS